MAKQNLKTGEELEPESGLGDVIKASMMFAFEEVRDSARMLVDRQIEKNRSNRLWLELAARYFYRTHRPDSAAIIYDSFLLRMPQPRDEYFCRLLAIYKFKKDAELVDILAVRLPWNMRSSRPILEALRDVYEALDKPEKVLEYSEKLVQRCPGYLPYIMNLARLYTQNGRALQALEIVRDYSHRYPRDLEALYQLGVFEADYGEPARTLECSRMALEIDTSFAAAWELKGLYFLETGATDSALYYFDRTIKKNCLTPLSYYYLGEHHLQKGDSLDRAAGLGMAAARFFGRDRRGYYLLGRAYLEMGKYKLARSSFRNGVLLFPKDAELNFLLGKAFYLDGQKEEAREHLKNSLKLGLGSPQKEEANRFLRGKV